MRKQWESIPKTRRTEKRLHFLFLLLFFLILFDTSFFYIFFRSDKFMRQKAYNSSLSSSPFRSSDTLFGILAQFLFLLEDEEIFYITCSV